MNCEWSAFMNLLPTWMRCEMDGTVKQTLQELRLRIGLKPELRMHGKSKYISGVVEPDDLNFIINRASMYSPWVAETLKDGYITAPGGHRLGICGDAVIHNGRMTGIKNPTSICLRIARDIAGIGNLGNHLNTSILVIGRPGSGKTTLLRDIIRHRSNMGQTVAVVDERGEVFPKFDGKFCFPTGDRTDILHGSGKEHGINIALRTMNPDVIAVDEITAFEDCAALVNAGWCGVDLIATAHARTKTELLERPVYKPLLDKKLFQTLVILHPDKHWSAERMDK